jgi:hypothetical protein
MMFDGTKQANMLKQFARSYNVKPSVRFYDVTIGKTRALYRGSRPNPIKNRRLGATFYRWEWHAPLGMARRCDFVFLHGLPSRKWKVRETIFVIRKRELESQIHDFPGQKEKISLDASRAITPNKRTAFYFSLKTQQDPAKFRSWLKGKDRHKKSAAIG